MVGQKISVTALAKQIDDYGYTKGSRSCLSDEGIKALNQGIQQYEIRHKNKVRAYKDANGIPEANGPFVKREPHFFRQQLIEYLSRHPIPPFTGDEALREKNPESAIISLEALIGPKGVELYRLALEEEMHSREYRHAVVMKSTTHYEGAKWTQRPVVIVAGPSASGKSYAAQKAVGVASRFLPTDDDNQAGNDILAVDGGVGREVSQMRKLMVQIANNNGYPGIKDLHSQSKALEKLKSKVQEAAFKSPDLGIVIPETFSKWALKPNARNMLKKIEQLPNTKHIFTRVVGENPVTFEKTVGFMGSRRAWKVNGFKDEPEDLNLNKEDLTESKAYGAAGFRWGKLGSLLAEIWFRKYSKDKLSMIINNDLILLKPDPNASTLEKWIPAEQTDDGARLFSRNAYVQWLKLPMNKKSSLPEYCKANAKLNIVTSAQIDFAIAQKGIEQRLNKVNRSLEKEYEREERNQDKIRYLLNKRDLLSNIKKIDPQILNSPAAINKVQHQINQCAIFLGEKEEKIGNFLFSVKP